MTHHTPTTAGKMEMREHTPTPWKISNSCEDFGTDKDEALIVATVPADPACDVEEMDIAIATMDSRDFDWQMSDHSPSRARTAANAKFIIEAVNSHATNLTRITELEAEVKALREALKPLAARDVWNNRPTQDDIDRARSLIPESNNGEAGE